MSEHGRYEVKQVPDHCTRAAAAFLAKRLECFWKSKGFPKIKCTVEQAVPSTTLHNAAFGVRSNMINGLPPR